MKTLTTLFAAMALSIVLATTTTATVGCDPGQTMTPCGCMDPGQTMTPNCGAAPGTNDANTSSETASATTSNSVDVYTIGEVVYQMLALY